MVCLMNRVLGFDAGVNFNFADFAIGTLCVAKAWDMSLHEYLSRSEAEGAELNAGIAIP